MPRRCLQCLNPPCVSLCPLGAARQRPTGAVYTEMSLCFGDSQCIAVCPWHIPRLQAGVGPYLHLAPGYLGYGQTFKCDFCEDIISDGKPPLCVEPAARRAAFRALCGDDGPGRRMAEERHGDLFGLQENGGTCLIYVSSIPFRDIEASLLRQGLISAGRPSLRPAGASLERENDLVGTVLAAPLAGAALARPAPAARPPGGTRMRTERRPLVRLPFPFAVADQRGLGGGQRLRASARDLPLRRSGPALAAARSLFGHSGPLLGRSGHALSDQLRGHRLAGQGLAQLQPDPLRACCAWSCWPCSCFPVWA